MPIGGIIGGDIGLIDGGAIGAMLGGRGGAISSVLSQSGTCRHGDDEQSHSQVHAALASVAERKVLCTKVSI